MRVLTKVAAVAVLALSAACGGGGDDGFDPISIAGTYNLQTIDGQAPPVVVYEEPAFKVEITSGNFILAAGGSFTTTVVWRLTEDNVATTETESFPGTYTVNGSTVTFNYSDGDTDTATLAGNTLTFNDAGTTAVFQK